MFGATLYVLLCTSARVPRLCSSLARAACRLASTLFNTIYQMTSSSIPFTKLSSLPSYSKTSPSRLQALYADISRQKTSNPTAFQSNVSWWRATLDAIVSNGWQSSTPDKLVLKADRSLPESLRYEGTGKPLCLATVVVSSLWS